MQQIEVSLKSTASEGLMGIGWKTTALLLALGYYWSQWNPPVYMIDFSTFEAPDEWKVLYCTHIFIKRNIEKKPPQKKISSGSRETAL